MTLYLLARGILHAMSSAESWVVGHPRLAMAGGIAMLALALWI